LRHARYSEPQACRFAATECADPVSEYAVAYECWASDLLASLRCELVNHALSAGHSRHWFATPIPFDFNELLLTYLTPTRFPQAFLERYRSVVRS
jgi:hypothetical protein